MIQKKDIEAKIYHYMAQNNKLPSGKVLSQYYHCSEQTINYYLQKYGLRKKDIMCQLPSNFIKSFEQITSETSYWLGYLHADGCVNITKKNRKRLILECQAKDKEILYNFCNYCNINTLRIKNTKHKDTKAVRLDLYSTSFSIFPDWIQPNKTYKQISLYDYPNNIDFYAFLNGLLDGDGTIHIGKNDQVIFLIQEPMCYEIVDRLKENLLIPSSIWIQNHPTTETLKRITIGNHKNIIFIRKKFYENSNHPFLTRKKEKFYLI